MNTKTRLLNAAESCLKEQGSHAASVKNIAGIAGVNHGLIHHYFGSKENMFIELAKRIYGEIVPTGDFRIETSEDLIRYFRAQQVSRYRLIVEMQAMAFQMPNLARELAEIHRRQQENMGQALNIRDPESRMILSALFYGVGHQMAFDPDTGTDSVLERVFILMDDFLRSTRDT